MTIPLSERETIQIEKDIEFKFMLLERVINKMNTIRAFKGMTSHGEQTAKRVLDNLAEIGGNYLEAIDQRYAELRKVIEAHEKPVAESKRDNDERSD